MIQRGVFVMQKFSILVIVFVFFTVAVNSSFSCHLIAFQIFIVGSDLIDQLAVDDLHDTVGSGLYDLVVTG